MKKKRSVPKLPIAQFIAIIALSISLFLIVDLGRRAASNYRIQREAERLNQEVEAARRYQSRLLAQRTYAASDLYVEEVARRELKWAKPNEVVVVVLPTPEAAHPLRTTPQVEQTVRPIDPPAQAGWQLFFGQRRPDSIAESSP